MVVTETTKIDGVYAIGKHDDRSKDDDCHYADLMTKMVYDK